MFFNFHDIMMYNFLLLLLVRQHDTQELVTQELVTQVYT